MGSESLELFQGAGELLRYPYFEVPCQRSGVLKKLRAFRLMTDQKGFEKPNHTQTPNSFFDDSLKNITSLPELKVVLAIIRKTLGWQKTRDRISMTQLETLTGLGHQSVQRGIDLALKDGFIERERVGQQGFSYSLKLVTPCDQSPDVTSHPLLLEPVTPCDQNQSPLVTNKRKKEKKEKEIPLVIPFCGAAFTEALADFMTHHREINKPYKPTGLKRLYDDLKSWGELGATESLRASVRNRWQGVFPPKGNGANLYPEHPNAHRPGKIIT